MRKGYERKLLTKVTNLRYGRKPTAAFLADACSSRKTHSEFSSWRHPLSLSECIPQSNRSSPSCSTRPTLSWPRNHHPNNDLEIAHTTKFPYTNTPANFASSGPRRTLPWRDPHAQDLDAKPWCWRFRFLRRDSRGRWILSPVHRDACGRRVKRKQRSRAACPVALARKTESGVRCRHGRLR